MSFNEIPISNVMLWAKKEQSKWEELVGCFFHHDLYGPLELISVTVPYLRFLENEESADWNIEHLEKYFSSINENQNCPEILQNYSQILEAINKEKQKEEKRKQWCKKFDLDFVEIKKLKEKEPSKGALNKVLRCYQNNLLIPRKDLKWIFEEKGQVLIRRYVTGSSKPGHQGFFKSKKPLQKRKDFKKCFDQKGINYGKFYVNYLHDYIPTNRGHNDENSKRILDFKKGHLQAVHFYWEKLKDVFQPNVLICCVPSSQAGIWGSGLRQLLSKLDSSSETNICLLKRITTVPEKKKQREREWDVKRELNSLEITDQDRIRDKRIIIIDDVCTTGASLFAASLKIWNSGANCVGTLALSSTRKKIN